MENLSKIIESILFVAGDSVELFEIADKLQIELEEVKAAAEQLKKEKEDLMCGIQILLFNNKAQLCSNPEYVEQVKEVLNPIKERQLTKAVLEVCSIIAYKQPVTRTDVENIRGKDSDYAINCLIENNIIEVVGRKDAVGKPLLFGTTDNFLKKFGLSSLDDLPDYDELLERIKVLYENKSDNSLFDFRSIPEEGVTKATDEEQNLTEEEENQILESIGEVSKSVEYELDKNDLDKELNKIMENLNLNEENFEDSDDGFFENDNKF